jgi:hypothetical protein
MLKTLTRILPAALLAAWAHLGAAQPVATLLDCGLVSWSTSTSQPQPLFSTPAFLHELPTSTTTAAAAPTAVLYSTSYISPPLNTTQPLHVGIAARLSQGRFSAYYPFSAQADAQQINWPDIIIGAQADPLDTDVPTWRIARAVGEAATLKVYKPGAPGAQPDDPGTTEGEVFLYMQGELAAANPLTWSDGETSESIVTSWFYERRPDATAYFAHLRGGLKTVPTASTGDFTTTAATALLDQMREALNAQGLPDDIVISILQSLQQPLFDLAGRHLVAILQPRWPQKYLPLNTNGPLTINRRVYLALIELHP